MFTTQGRSDVHLSPLKWIKQQINIERYKVSTYLTFCLYKYQLGCFNSIKNLVIVSLVRPWEANNESRN